MRSAAKVSGQHRINGEAASTAEDQGQRSRAYWLLSNGDQWAFSGPQRQVAVKVLPRLYSNSGDTCCVAALHHQGIVLQPSFLVAPHIASGALMEVLPAYRASELGVYAVYPSRKHLAPKVRALIDFLVDAFRTRAWPV